MFLQILEAETILEILSYLEFQASVSFVKACDKLLLSKIRGCGGFRSITSHFPFLNRDRNFGTQPYKETLEPTVLDEGMPLRYYLRTLNHPIFSCLTSFTFWPDPASSFHPKVDVLPKTLTHLNWSGEKHPFFIKKKGPLIKDCLPNLLHLSVRVPSEDLLSPLSEFFEQLPCLLSLTFPMWNDDDFALLAALPSSLTQLAPVLIPLRRYGFPSHRVLTSKHFSVPMPPGLTDLRLYAYNFELSDEVTMWHWPFLKRLHLAQCTPNSLEQLPSTIEHLELLNGLKIDRGELPLGESKWPPKLSKLVVPFSKNQPFLGIQLPSKCSIPSNIHTLTLINPAYDSSILIEAMQTLLLYLPQVPTSKLVLLEFPNHFLKEEMLRHIPSSITRVSLMDVHLDGTSIPPGTDVLDTQKAVHEMFWRSPRHFALLLRTSHPLHQFKNFKLPPSITSIRFLGHELRIEDLPNPGIKIAENIVGSGASLSVLPDTLTHLSFSEKTTSLATLKLSALRNLKYLRHATIQLDSSFLPSADSHSGVHTRIVLPDDAIAIFYERYKHIHFEKVELCENWLLENVSGFPATYDLQMSGLYYIMPEFAAGGFKEPLSRVSFEKTVFRLAKSGFIEHITPKLPDSVLELSLGATESALFLNPIHSTETAFKWLPKRLQELTINKQDYTSRAWQFPPLATLQKLTVRAPYIDSNQVASLPRHLNKRRLDAAEEVLVAEASDSPSNCMIM
jgi:hypothetical protein